MLAGPGPAQVGTTNTVPHQGSGASERAHGSAAELTARGHPAPAPSHSFGSMGSSVSWAVPVATTFSIPASVIYIDATDDIMTSDACALENGATGGSGAGIGPFPSLASPSPDTGAAGPSPRTAVQLRSRKDGWLLICLEVGQRPKFQF